MTERLSVEEFRKINKGKSYQALGRLKAGTMNGLEKRYAALLDHKMAVGEILDYWFEAMNLRLAPNCFYKIDFLVLTKDMALEVHETKGMWTDDALVKIKVAAEKFPFRFIALQWIKKEWVVREF
jgi:hypothetical protein